MASSDTSRNAHLALVLVQTGYGGYHVIAKLALSVGVNQLVFCAIRDAIALFILGPLAYTRERRVRPPMSAKFLFTFLFLGFTGVYANQLLFMVGLNLTSPGYAASLQPAIPVFTFLLALLTGSETVQWHRHDGKAKVAGICLCVLGALLMAAYRGPAVIGDGFSDMNMQAAVVGKPSPEPAGWLATALITRGVDMWHVGIVCLIGNCMCMAAYLAVQAPLLGQYPAALSVTAYSYLFGAMLMALTGLFGANDVSDWMLTRPELLSVLYAGCVASALNYGLLTWANKVLGPSLVALYMPLQPLASALLSRVFLGCSVYLGSILGGCLIIAGLYSVTWGRREAERLQPGYRRLGGVNKGERLSDPLLKAVVYQRGTGTPHPAAVPVVPTSHVWSLGREKDSLH